MESDQEQQIIPITDCAERTEGETVSYDKKKNTTNIYSSSTRFSQPKRNSGMNPMTRLL